MLMMVGSCCPNHTRWGFRIPHCCQKKPAPCLDAEKYMSESHPQSAVGTSEIEAAPSACVPSVGLRFGNAGCEREQT